jgi:hypothetical protein
LTNAPSLYMMCDNLRLSRFLGVLMNNYWQKSLAARVSRRRAIIATGSAGLGAAFLAACGSDGGDGATGDKSGLLTKAQDTTKQAKRGGVWPNYVASDVQTLDPNRTTSGSALAPQGYSRLFLYRPSAFPDLPTGAVDPDSAESAEISPDGLQVTVRLKPDLSSTRALRLTGAQLTRTTSAGAGRHSLQPTRHAGS